MAVKNALCNEIDRSGRAESDPAGMEGFAPKVLAWAGAALISIVGLVHLLLVGEHFEAPPTWG